VFPHEWREGVKTMGNIHVLHPDGRVETTTASVAPSRRELAGLVGCVAVVLERRDVQER